jgi:Kef-type K+ transport system membrane component KefB
LTNAVWFVVIGTLLILMGLRSPVLQRLNLTPSMVYLSVGVLLGPSILGVFHFNPLKQSHLLEVLAELAVLLSLFIAGTKMPVPFVWKTWRAPLRLAVISMTISVALTAAFGYYVLGLPLWVRRFCWGAYWRPRTRYWQRRFRSGIWAIPTRCGLP